MNAVTSLPRRKAGDKRLVGRRYMALALLLQSFTFTPLPAPAVPRRSLCTQQLARTAQIGLAYDIYAEVPKEEVQFQGTANELFEIIFLKNAEGTMLKPGSPMYTACQELAKANPSFKALSNDALVGRLFQFLDDNGDGIIDLQEVGAPIPAAFGPLPSLSHRLYTHSRLAVGVWSQRSLEQGDSSSCGSCRSHRPR